MQYRKIYENKQICMSIILAIYAIIYCGIVTIDPFKIKENFISVIIYLLLTIFTLICAVALMNIIEGIFIKILRLFKIRYFIIYPFTYEIGSLQFRPFRMLERTCIFNDAYLLNLIKFSKKRQIKLQKKLFLLRIIAMYAVGTLCAFILYYLTSNVICILIPFASIILFHINQYFHWNDWRGDAYLMIENERISYFLKFTIHDIDEEFLNNIEPYIYYTNDVERAIDYIDRYIDTLILNNNIQVNLMIIEKYYEYIKNEFTKVITIDQVIIYSSVLRIQNSIAFIGLLRNDKVCIDKSKALKNEFKTYLSVDNIKKKGDIPNMNFNQDRLFASGAKRSLIINKLMKEMSA